LVVSTMYNAQLPMALAGVKAPGGAMHVQR
jgi:hypothetical protein